MLTACRYPLLLLTLALFSFSRAWGQHDSLSHAVSISYDHTHFNKQFANDWQLLSLEYKRRFAFGTLLGRVNRASRFGRSGWQSEVEAYPSLSKKMYAYAGVSYASDRPVFPRWRVGSTLYYNLSKGWEAEAGFRFLSFDESIWMGTAGVSKYVGNWLFSSRSFFSLNTAFASQSFFLKAQRYLQNEQDYVWLQVGSGVSPDEARSVQLNSPSRLLTQRLNAGAKLSLSQRLQLTFAAGYAKDEYRVKTFGNQYNGSAGVSIRF